LLLLLDTSLAEESLVALADERGSRLHGTRVYPRREGGSAHLLKGAHELLDARGAGLEALKGLVVNRGPGSYTGLRIGFGLAQGLSETRTLPVVSVPSFDAFAAGHREHGVPLVVCYDARSRGIAFVIFPADSEGPIKAGSDAERRAAASAVEDRMELGERGVLIYIAPAAALPGLVPRPSRLVGPGVRTLARRLEGEIPSDLDLVADTRRAEPQHMAALGAQRLLEGAEDPVAASPYYLGTVAAPAANDGR